MGANGDGAPLGKAPTNEGDLINGTNFDDYLRGTDGNDTINGHRGDDTILGGEGHDDMYGGLGNDYLFGGDGDDYGYGGSGNDVLNMGAGDDSAFGGAGNDVMYDVGGGVNVQYGGDGNDFLYIEDESSPEYHAYDDINRQYGNDGNDTIYMVGGTISAEGGEGADVFNFSSSGTGARHMIEGGEGIDHYQLGNADGLIFASIVDFEEGETMTFFDGFGPGVSTLDTNDNGILDNADAYVSTSGSTTRIVTDEIYVLITHDHGYDLQADAFMIA